MITHPDYGAVEPGCAGAPVGPGYARPPMGTTKFAALVAVLALAGACRGDGGGKGDARAAVADSTTTTGPASTTTAAPPESSTTTSAPARPSTTAKPAAASPTTATTGRTGGSGPQTAPHATVFVAAAPTDPAELDRLADQLAADETALRSPAT